MDAIDKKLLYYLQNDSTIQLSDLAQKVHLSKTPCWRRIQKLEKNGVIKRRVALLDAQKVGPSLIVFVYVKTNQHNAKWLSKFAARVSEFPEVMEFYRLSGNWDYFIRVIVPDVAGYDRFYKKLVNITDLVDVTASFAMEEIKYSTAIPFDQHLNADDEDNKV